MLAKLFLPVVAIALTTRSTAAQSLSPAPDECFGFSFGKWEPSLRSTSSTYSPGYDPTGSAPAGAPRSWATRAPTSGGASAAPADSVLLLFPPWWPAGVAIQWTSQRGDTLIGIARALVADGRVKNPQSAVRALRVSCRSESDTSRVRRDTVARSP
jgi:hypothetical protein